MARQGAKPCDRLKNKTWETLMRMSGGVFIGAIGGALLFASVGLADDRPLSAAQIALFESNHLQDIGKPVVLEYTFRHQGGIAGDFEDKVTADIRTIHPDGKKDIWIEFLTGPHHVNFPPALGFNGNPLLMFFLEHDASEMREATGGAAQYFRNRIRQAFVDKAEMHSVDITYDGKPEKATEIALAPFHDDPQFAQVPAVRDKTYHFILADGVPGRVYQISTTLPSHDMKNAFEEAMTYRSEHDETP
jgi:hypothetical protein